MKINFSEWLEIPFPNSKDSFQLVPAEPEGQLVISDWMPGGTLPMEPCEVVGDFLSGGTADSPKISLRRICWFDGRDFLFRRHGSKLNAECIRWMALPPEEEVP